jgi:hypothetical protein
MPTLKDEKITVAPDVPKPTKNDAHQSRVRSEKASMRPSVPRWLLEGSDAPRKHYTPEEQIAMGLKLGAIVLPSMTPGVPKQKLQSGPKAVK